MAKKHGPATQMGLRQAEINKKNLQGKAPEVAPMIDLGGDQVDIGFNANTIEDPMLMRHLKGVPKQPSVQDIIEEIEDNFQYIELLANATPYGMMVPYALTIEPVDWVFCNGQVCPESPLRDLLIEQGNPFGESGGLPTVPNLSGRSIVGNTAMGNVQQPALDQTATELNKTLGTTSGLFTIKSDVAPQREFNIGTTDNGGLLSITIDNSFTGLSITDPDQANLTIDGADADITINNGKADLVDNNSATPVAGEKKNTTTELGLTANTNSANIRSASSGGDANTTATGKAVLNGVPDGSGIGSSTASLGSGAKTAGDGQHSHRFPFLGSSTGWVRDGGATSAEHDHSTDDTRSRTLHGEEHNRIYRSITNDYVCIYEEQGYHQPRLFREQKPYGYDGGMWEAIAETPGHQHSYDHHHAVYDVGHAHNVYDQGHSHSIDPHSHNIWDRNHAHGITQENHDHDITQQDHTHGITDVEHNHVAHATGTIPGSDFEFDLTQPGLVVNFIIFHGQHLPEDTEPVVRHNELAPIIEELEAATQANAELIEQNMAMMKKLEEKINV